MSEKTEPTNVEVTCMDQPIIDPMECSPAPPVASSRAEVEEFILIEAWRRSHEPQDPDPEED